MNRGTNAFEGHSSGHFDETTGLVFLDGQLDPLQSARVSEHADRCPACRSLLSALEGESRLLGQALQEETEPLPARLFATLAQEHSSRRIAPWAWALSFVVAGAAIYAAWVTILGPWLDQLDLLGMGSTNLLATMFFSGAFWGGWSSMLDTLQYTMVAGVGIAALLLARGRSRRWIGSMAAVGALVFLFGMPGSASAADIRRGAAVTIAEGETLHNDLIAAGNSVHVDGTVDGDVIAFTQNLMVNGHVSGDVIAFAQTVRIIGPVDGNVRCFCGSLELEGPVAKNATFLTRDMEIDSKASLGGSVIALSGNVLLDGKVMRDLLLFAGNTTLNGSVGGNVLLRGGSLTIGPSAQVGGSVRVTGNRQPEVAPSAKMGSPMQYEFRARRRGFRSPAAVVVRAILRYAGAFLFGLLLITALPGLFSTAMRATRHAGLALGVGAIVLICGFAVIVLSILLLLAGVGAGVATVFLYAPLVYTAQVFVGAWIGERLRGPVAAHGALLGRLALGLLVLHVIELIPVLGGLVWLAAAIWGTGALCMALWELLRFETPAAASPAVSLG